jgi:hypothetical protein
LAVSATRDAWSVGDKRVTPEGGHQYTLRNVATGETDVIEVSPRSVREIREISNRYRDMLRRLAQR